MTGDWPDDPWLRPDPGAAAVAPWARRPEPAPAPLPEGALLLPLARAEDALSRLDALAGAAPPAVRAGLAARMALAEGAGWLSVEEIWVHPGDLALREAGLTGSMGAAMAGARLSSVMPATLGEIEALPSEAPADAAIESALGLVRALGALALARDADPLDSPEAFAQAMAPLGPARWPVAAAGAVPDFALWREALLQAGESRPALLAAAEAATRWAREAGEAEPVRPTAAQALLVAAMLARRRGRLHHVPLPFWAALTGRMGPRRPALHMPSWPVAFLAEVAEGARRGLAELDRLNMASQKAQALAAKERSHGQAGKAAEIALRQPLVTAAGLATALGATPQGALLIIKRLIRAGILREATGRASFRAFMV